jgi:eukaryotic-like serine/threonine-protein kinase
MACSREFPDSIGHCPHDGNVLVGLPSDPWVGRTLSDKYNIQSIIGTGGMGVVYLGWHSLMSRQVAIKMLRAQFINDSASVKRFQQEARAAGLLKHPNVITTYDFGVTNNGQPYMVMDYLIGLVCDCKSTKKPNCPHRARSLAENIKETKGISVERAMHILAQACDALDHAHKSGVIHRDVKPQNIMIVPNDEDLDFVKVVDFGVAKLIPINQVNDENQQSLTQAGEICGSPVYMSPEQCMGQALDKRADIYSMGVVAYEAITGRVPLMGKNMVDTMQKHMAEKPPSFKSVRPDLYVHEKVEQVVMRALSKQPHERQQSMAELAQDFRFAIPKPGQTPNLRVISEPPPSEVEPAKFNWMIPAAVAAVVAIAGGAWYMFGAKSGDREKSATATQVNAVKPAGDAGQNSPSTKPAAPDTTRPVAAVTPPPKVIEKVKVIYVPVVKQVPVQAPTEDSSEKPVRRKPAPVQRPTPTAVAPSAGGDRFLNLRESRSSDYKRSF